MNEEECGHETQASAHRNPDSYFRDTTAMCWAAREGNLQLLKDLVSRGGNVNGAEYDDITIEKHH